VEFVRRESESEIRKASRRSLEEDSEENPPRSFSGLRGAAPSGPGNSPYKRNSPIVPEFQIF
jgi:hypothetical protein